MKVFGFIVLIVVLSYWAHVTKVTTKEPDMLYRYVHAAAKGSAGFYCYRLNDKHDLNGKYCLAYLGDMGGTDESN